MKSAYIVLGMPGAGKDTQTEHLANVLNATIIKTGDIARALAETNTIFAQQLKEGALVDARIIEHAVVDEIEKPSTKPVIIFNGFPRQLEQAIWLDDYLTRNGIILKRVFYLKLARSNALSRLLARHRDDDQQNVIKHRLDIFEDETLPVVEHYVRAGRLVELEAGGSVEQVNHAIEEHIV